MKLNQKSVLGIGCGAAFIAACSGKLVVDDRKGNLEPKDGGGGASGTDASRATGGGVSAGGVGTRGAGGVSEQPEAGRQDSGQGGTGGTVLPRWTGNPNDCPVAQPTSETACSAAPGRTCAYYTPDQGGSIYNFCNCLPATETSTLWSCVENGATGALCPSTQPEEGSACVAESLPCQYPPHTACTCAGQSPGGGWHCGDPDFPGLPNGTHPTTVDESKRVRDLTDAERQAWCAWYEVLVVTYRPPYSPPPEGPLSPDGYTMNTGCNISNGDFACRGNMPTSLPVSYCKGNLGLSTCEAPVSELSDCVLTTLRGCLPSPFGCALYLGAPGCSGTIVMNPAADAGAYPPDPTADCPVRVR